MWPWKKGASPSKDEPVWGDTERQQLEETIRSLALGEARFQQNPEDRVAESLFEVYVAEEAPESELESVYEFVREEVGRRFAAIKTQAADWPTTTDCDRLDDAEENLLKAGILFWQASPCCDSCTIGDMPSRIEEIDSRHPGSGDRLRGYAFFIDQTIAERLGENEEIDLYLAYGWFNKDEDIDQAEYERGVVAIGHEVVEHLEAAGLHTNWNGDIKKKIGVDVTWRRRTLLK